MRFGFDPLYLIMILPALAFTLWAQWKVKSSYNKWSNVPNSRGISGAQAARYLLDSNGQNNVQVEQSQGMLSDHYDPRAKVLRLSPQVYGVPSVAAVGIAAHEMGHALQDKENYGALRLRSALVPVANIGSSFGIWVIIAGLLLQMTPLAWLGVILFGAGFVFSLITLPVEFDASRRAMRMMDQSGLLQGPELAGAKEVLTSAAWTYIAAAAASLLTLLYWVTRVSGSSRRS